MFFGVRMSSALRSLITQGGESSAAARALLIIGAATSGLDLADVREELLDLISSRLQPAVRASLLTLVSERSAQPLLTHSQTADEEGEVEKEAVLGDQDGAGFDV